MSHNLQELKLNVEETIIYKMAWAFYTTISDRNPDSSRQCHMFFCRKDPRLDNKWDAFQKLYNKFKDNAFFNMYWHVNAQLIHMSKNQTLWPHQLLTQKAEKNYFEYCRSRKIVLKSDSARDIMSALAQSKKLIQEWFKNNDTTSYERLFEYISAGLLMSDGVYYAIRGMLSIFFLAISRTFLTTYKNLDIDIQQEIADTDQLIIIRNRLRSNKRVYTFAKKIFGDEIL